MRLWSEMLNQRGFLVLEILIAGIILTTSIAASMYLFKMGFEHLQRANDSNVLSSRLPDVMALLKVIDIDQKSGSESLGNGVVLHWESRLVDKTRPVRQTVEGDTVTSIHELYLYRVDFRLRYKDIERSYNTNVFRYKRLLLEKDVFF